MAPHDEKGVSPPRSPFITVNGKRHLVDSSVPPNSTLLHFIREKINLTGTKHLCSQGGCGLCTVVATKIDKETGKTKSFSILSCQTLTYLCYGWSIETIEHLGDRFKGYHSLQKALAGFYGTQCGFCSPGMVMTMYGQLKSSGHLTSEQVEKSLDGNLCRCTGYRPILDAFKSLTVDGDKNLKEKMEDIEDLYTKCSESDKPCTGSCPSACSTEETRKGTLDDLGEVDLQLGATRWIRPTTFKDLLTALDKCKETDRVLLAVGNTASGLYHEKEPFNVYIDTSSVPELYVVEKNKTLKIGANISISRAIEVFKERSQQAGFSYLNGIADHWEKVATVSIRNVASWAGNLAVKHEHKEFVSDIFVTFLACNAVLQIAAVDGTMEEKKLDEFMDVNMKKQLIVSVILPAFDDETHIYTYKVAPRFSNALAYISAAFRIKLDSIDGYKVLEEPCICYAGISPNFISSKAAATALVNQKLTDEAAVKNGASVLGTELQPTNSDAEASPQYRISLAQALFYKTVISILRDYVSLPLRSAGEVLQRPISSSRQNFDMNENTWPVGKAIPKIESNLQVSGEAEFLNDVCVLPNELHGAFVQTSVAKAIIASIDTSEATKMNGVVAYITAKDIPGMNNFAGTSSSVPDKIFITDSVHYAGQSVGLIVATSRQIARQAAKAVKISYSDVKKPVLYIKDAIHKVDRVEEIKVENNKLFNISDDVEENMQQSDHVLEGELEQGTQCHFPMEVIGARVVPTEDGFDVLASTQHITSTQSVLAKVLNVPANSIKMSVRRLGGAFGQKITRSNIVAAAAAVAALKLRRPIRVILDLKTQMTLIGWRESYYSKHKVGFNKDGKLNSVQVDMYADGGYIANEVSVDYAVLAIPNVYHASSWSLKPFKVNTDTAANTWCRTPGTVEAIATMENIMEHVACFLKKDPLEIRELNMVKKTIETPLDTASPVEENNVIMNSLLPLLKEKAMIAQRKEEVANFNKENVWKKRGLSVVPMVYHYNYPLSFKYGILVTVYKHDGTIIIEHGGIEMGQGINTKVAQVAAYTLGVPLDFIKVKPTTSFAAANSSVTGGSFGSDLNCHGIKEACTELKVRMEPIKEKMKKWLKRDPTWAELVQQCYLDNVDLCSRFWTNRLTFPKGYDVYGIAALEVEIDVLTGQYLLRRLDVIEDCGRSISPFVDIGQIEGSFIMGFGLYTTENVIYETNTGQKLSCSTWNYHIPTALDIPIDFRITLLPNSSMPNPLPDFGVFRSKATGEPPLCLSYVIVTALRAAVSAAREDAGVTGWFDMPTPVTVEKIQQLCLVSPERFSVIEKTEDFVEKLKKFFYL